MKYGEQFHNSGSLSVKSQYKNIADEAEIALQLYQKVLTWNYQQSNSQVIKAVLYSHMNMIGY